MLPMLLRHYAALSVLRCRHLLMMLPSPRRVRYCRYIRRHATLRRYCRALLLRYAAARWQYLPYDMLRDAPRYDSHDGATPHTMFISMPLQDCCHDILLPCQPRYARSALLRAVARIHADKMAVVIVALHAYTPDYYC